jgi:DUF218 domain
MRLGPTLIVILGLALERNGQLPIPLVGRLKTAVNLISNNNYEKPTALLTGADTVKCGISEAEAMKSWLGIQLRSDINYILEEQAKNTVENAIYCCDILKNLASQSIDLITNEFHMPRAKCIFEHVLNEKGLRDLRIQCHPADSGHGWGLYRPIDQRPSTTDVRTWHLCERLDWERNALQTLNSYLARYSLPAVPQSRIDRALEELRELNRTSQQQQQI